MVRPPPGRRAAIDGDRADSQDGQPGGPSAALLIAAVAAGSDVALGQLYDRYAARLIGVALRVLENEADAAEAVLDAFVQAWERAAEFDRARGSVLGWLCVLVRSRALDRRRALRSQRQRIDAAADQDPGRSPAMGGNARPTSGRVEASELRGHLNEALDRLPSEQRVPIELAYFSGLTQVEIAARLGAPLGTVKTRIRTGMSRLRESLQGLYGETRT